MTALWIALGILALLLLLAWMPVGVEAAYAGSLQVRVRAGFLRFSVYPAEKAAKAAEKQRTAKGKSSSGAEAKKRRLPNRRQLAYAADTLLPDLFRALGRLGRRVRIPVLRVRGVFAGEDPADTAILCGKVQAAAAVLLPALERLVRVDQADVSFSADYQAEQTDISGEIRLRVCLGDLLLLGCAVLRSAVSWLREYRALAEEEKPAGAASAA